METGPGDGASILNRPHDTEARTLLAWLGILSGKVREVMHPADHPPGHAAVRVGNCIMAAQEAW